MLSEQKAEKKLNTRNLKGEEIDQEVYWFTMREIEKIIAERQSAV